MWGALLCSACRAFALSCLREALSRGARASFQVSFGAQRLAAPARDFLASILRSASLIDEISLHATCKRAATAAICRHSRGHTSFFPDDWPLCLDTNKGWYQDSLAGLTCREMAVSSTRH